MFDSGRWTIHGVTVTGVTDVGSPYTQQNASVRFRSFDDPWGQTAADWRCGRGVPVHSQVSGVGHSRESHGSLSSSLWGWALQGVSGGCLSGRGADEERAGVVTAKPDNLTSRVEKKEPDPES